MSGAVVFDIEANGFYDTVSQLLCIVTHDLETQELKAFHDTKLYPRHGSLSDGLAYLTSFECIIGHNILTYDVPVLVKLYPELAEVLDDIGEIDTQKLCEILFPDVKKQGIEEWVKILGLPDPKIQVSDFSYLSQKLLNRCLGDVKNNVALYNYLIRQKRSEERGGNSFNAAIKLEHDVARLHSKQEIHGVYYDVALALKTVDQFTEKMNVLEAKVTDLAPPILTIPSLTKEKQKDLRKECLEPLFSGYLTGQTASKKSKFDKTINPFLKSGKLTSQVREYFGDVEANVKGPFCKVSFELEDWYTKASIDYFGEDYIRNVKGPYNKIEINPINCSSDTQIKDFLLSLGWVPIEYNYSKTTNERTSPKLTEESFGSLPPGLGQDIAEFRILQHRRSLITNIKDPENKGALSHVREDHRVPAEAFTCGTPTARYRHSGAVCNIPRPTSKYGNEIRRLYRVAPGHLQIGIDLSGIEARMLTNFCYEFEGGPEFAELVLNGDWHSENAKLWMCDRNDAKTELYALRLAHVKPIENRESLNRYITIYVLRDIVGMGDRITLC